jgi:hypothetical protein
VNQRLGQILFAAEWQAFIARAERLAGRYAASVRNARDALDAFSAMGNLGRLPALFDDVAALEMVVATPPVRPSWAMPRLATPTDRAASKAPPSPSAVLDK